MVIASTFDLREIVAAVIDPEIPVLTIADLGILRSVVPEGDRVTVTITPTYSGCPAMRQISDDIAGALEKHGYDDVDVQMVHSPAWTTDWISDEGQRKLAEFGIAPPTTELEVLCPQCEAPAPRMVARFGSNGL